MDYSAIATQAKNDARDILRGQMAVRIQKRLADAKATLTGAIKAYANFSASIKKAAADKADADKKTADKRAAFDAELEAMDFLTSDELATVEDVVKKARAEHDASQTETATDTSKADARHLEELKTAIEAARDDVAHHEDNLTKLNAGDLKVSAEELETLANKLIEEGRVVVTG